MFEDLKINALIVGPIGTGKTHSLRTLVEDCGKELFVIATEPGIETILGDLPKDKCHWQYIPQAKTSWQVLIENAEDLNAYALDVLAKRPSKNKNKYLQFLQVLNALANFTDDRTGEVFGPVDDFGTERAVALDGMSGLSTMAMDLVVGAKPVKTQPEWGAAMDNLDRLNKKLTADMQCTFVLISHIDREKDELTGGTSLKVSTLGQKLAPEIPKPYDEVILSVRSGDKFTWSTTTSGVDLKTRLLPWKEGLPPTFKQLFVALENKKALAA